MTDKQKQAQRNGNMLYCAMRVIKELIDNNCEAEILTKVLETLQDIDYAQDKIMNS